MPQSQVHAFIFSSVARFQDSFSLSLFLLNPSSVLLPFNFFIFPFTSLTPKERLVQKVNEKRRMQEEASTFFSNHCPDSFCPLHHQPFPSSFPFSLSILFSSLFSASFVSFFSFFLSFPPFQSSKNSMKSIARKQSSLLLYKSCHRFNEASARIV